jgi:hypothetical protein
MKKELRSAFATLCDDAMATAAPSAVRLKKIPKASAYPGELSYAEPRVGGTAFTSFIPDGKRHAFTVELGWSADGVFPAVDMRPSHSPAAASGASGFVRLSEFINTAGYAWDAVPMDIAVPGSFERFLAFEMSKPDAEEATRLLRPLLEDAINAWSRHAPGFFERVAGAAYR